MPWNQWNELDKHTANSILYMFLILLRFRVLYSFSYSSRQESKHARNVHAMMHRKDNAVSTSIEFKFQTAYSVANEWAVHKTSLLWWTLWGVTWVHWPRQLKDLEPKFISLSSLCKCVFFSKQKKMSFFFWMRILSSFEYRRSKGWK